MSPIELGDLLAGAGYTRQDPADESGEFCVRGGVVEGRVVSAGTSAPVAGAYVTAYTSAGVEAGWAQADSEGRYRIVALRSGDYRITSSGNGHSRLSTTARVLLGETTPLDVGLSPRGALSVTVSADEMIVGRTVSLRKRFG